MNWSLLLGRVSTEGVGQWVRYSTSRQVSKTLECVSRKVKIQEVRVPVVQCEEEIVQGIEREDEDRA